MRTSIISSATLISLEVSVENAHLIVGRPHKGIVQRHLSDHTPAR